IEVSTYFTVGYVEFDDQGWLYGTNRFKTRMQIDTVINDFSEELKTNGLLIVTFVHGWKHNASSADSNVVMLHKVLNELGGMERWLSKKQDRPARRIVGCMSAGAGCPRPWNLSKNYPFGIERTPPNRWGMARSLNYCRAWKPSEPRATCGTEMKLQIINA